MHKPTLWQRLRYELQLTATAQGDLMPDPTIDPKEALIHIRTLARTGEDCTDLEAARKHFEMILTLVGKALPKGRK